MNQRIVHHRLGFTLLELILVLALFALVRAAATPALRSFARRGVLDDTAASLLALTQQAQTRAIHEAVVHRVVFDLAERRAWLEQAGEWGLEASPRPGTEPVDWGRTVTVASDISPSEYETVAIMFYPTGLVTPGSLVIEQGGHFVALTCDAAAERYRLLTVGDVSERDDAEGVLGAIRL